MVDGLSSEREQGITIDVAYRFFSTDKRKFVVIDAPGHEQYTKNMATGASNADLAIILVDSQKGIVQQTQRHSIICSILGIKNILLAVNKMDLVDYKKNVFDKIITDYKLFSKKLNFENIASIPISALHGTNFIKKSYKTSWYTGPTLLDFLEKVDFKSKINKKFLRFSVQLINRYSSDFRGYSGTIVYGEIKVGQIVKVLPSNENVKVTKIIFCIKKIS